MKTTQMILAAATALVLAGCASDRGGTRDEYNTSSGTATNAPLDASPTMRPGMNPDDFRDPNNLTRPSPPPVKPF